MPRPAIDSNRAAAVQSVVDRYVAALDEKAPMDADSLCAEFSPLMPDLAEALQAARILHAARRADTIDFSLVRDDSFSVADAWQFPPTGSRFGEYELVARVGEGGFGRVFHARHLPSGEIRAVKILRAGHASDPQILYRFRSEAALAHLLRHDNIVRVFESGEYEGQHFIAMQFVEGADLRRFCEGNSLSSEEAADVVRDVARTCAYAHDKDIIHRDIKPENILIESGTKKRFLTDFGLAKQLRSTSRHTDPFQLIGTLHYMAPEQADPQLGKVDKPIDIYALGITLYYLLCRRLPFAGADLDAIRYQIVWEDPPPLGANVPKPLRQICFKCLQKMTADRYDSAADLAADLERFIAGKPIQGRLPGPIRRLRILWARRPAVAAFFVLLIVGLFVGAGASAYYAAEARRETAEAQRQTEAKQQLDGLYRQLDHLYQQIDHLNYDNQIGVAYHAWKDNRLAYAKRLLGDCPEALRHWEWFFVHRLCNTDKVALRGHRSWIRLVAFSPDGRRVLTSASSAGGNSADIRVWDADSGKQLLQLDDLHGTLKPLIQLAVHGRTLIGLATNPNQLSAWDIFSGRPVQLNAHRPADPVVALSPDGNYCLTRKAGALSVWDLTTGMSGASITAPRFDTFVFSSDSRRIVEWGAFTEKVSVFSTSDGSKLVQLQNRFSGIICAAATQAQVALGFVDGTVSFWNSASGAEIWTAKPHRERITSIDFGPDELVLTSSIDGSAAVLDVRNRRPRFYLRGHLGPVRAAAMSADGRRIVTGGADNLAYVWDGDAQQEFRSFRAHRSAGVKLAISKDGSHLATCAFDRRCHVWDVASRTRIASFLDHADTVNGIAFSDDEHRLFSGSLDGTVKVWDASSGQIVKTYGPWNSPVVSLAVDPRNGTAVASCQDGTLKVMPNDENRPPTTHSIDACANLSMAFSPDGRRLALVGSSFLTILDAATWAPTFQLPDTPNRFTSAALLPDGRHIATSSEDGTLQLWDTTDGKATQTLQGPSSRVNCIAVSPDGERLISGGDDKTVRVWDIPTNRQVLLLDGPTVEVESLGVSADGAVIAAASYDGTIYTWTIR